MEPRAQPDGVAEFNAEPLLGTVLLEPLHLGEAQRLATGQPFIGAEERPEVGGQALQDRGDE